MVFAIANNVHLHLSWILDLISIPVHSVAAVLDPRVCATHNLHVFIVIPHHFNILVLKENTLKY